MYQRAHMEYVEASRRSEQRLELLICWDSCSSDVAPDGEGGPHPLASAQHLTGHQMHGYEFGPHGIEYR